MVAVGQVVFNRIADPRFPKDVCAVVKQRGLKTLRKCQFSWFCDGASDKPTDKSAWSMAREIANEMVSGHLIDPSLYVTGATCYHATWAETPLWAKSLKPIARIKEHVFYAC